LGAGIRLFSAKAGADVPVLVVAQRTDSLPCF
jgi:hypothetical protein